MKKTEKQQKILLWLMGLTLAFIWGNSLMPASVSGAISEWVRQIVNAIIGGVGGGSGFSGDGVLRKTAHMLEFLAWGAEVTVLLHGRLKEKWPLQLLLGLGVALIDETIQLFMAGRAGMVQDIWIDMGGFLTGCGIACGILRRKKKQRLNGEEQPS
jgi:VanZ family protein